MVAKTNTADETDVYNSNNIKNNRSNYEKKWCRAMFVQRRKSFGQAADSQSYRSINIDEFFSTFFEQHIS